MQDTSKQRRSAALPLAMSAALMLLLSACDEPEVVLSGKREPIRSAEELESIEIVQQSDENRSLAIALPTAQTNTAWTQKHVSPAVRVAHPAFSGAMAQAWSTNIGAGDSKHGRITADPIVAGGKIYTLDAEARVTATGANGAAVWSRDLVPARDAGKDATGGGLAYADGTVFVASGFGLLTALDAGTGAELWQQKLQATGSGTPTVQNGIVYLVSGDSTAWAVDAADGRVLWQLAASSDKNNVLGSPAPAVNDRFVIFSFGSNELQAAFRQGGLRIWDAVLAGQRSGFARSRISDVTGDPVIVGDTVYAGTHSGRMMALDAASGARKWTVEEGPMSAPWVVGGSIFIVTDANKLVRLEAETGARVWSVDLPFFVKSKPRRQKAVYAHFGPVLAGGRLYVASSDGLIRAFDPKDGSLISRATISGGAATAPVFAGGTMYVVSTKGQLFAFR